MIPELKDLSYEERPKEYGLTTLKTRRLRGDQIEVFKILNWYENIDRNIILFLLKKDNRARGHGVTLVTDQCRLDIRKYSFSQRKIFFFFFFVERSDRDSGSSYEGRCALQILQ